MDYISLIISVVIFLGMLKMIMKNRTKVSLDKLPGPKAYPVIGNLLDLMVSNEKYMQYVIEREKKYAPIYRTWLGPIPTVHMSKPEYIEIILSSSQHMTKGYLYKFLHPWLGKGLLTSDGQKWFKHRKLITPTFHFKILETFLDVYHENSEILVNKLREKAETGEVFDVYPLIKLCALDIICETAMGTKVYAQNQIHSYYVNAVYRVTSLTLSRCLKVWLHPDFIYYNTLQGKEYKEQLALLHGFTEKVIKERKEMRRKRRESLIPLQELEIGRTKKKKAFLDLLLDASGDDENAKLTDAELQEEVNTFMFEGHDTSTSAICWALFLLGLHQDVQEKAYNELEQIFKKNDTKSPTLRDLNEMKYLERVIKESLRLYPSVPLIIRKADDDIQCGEYLIPKGTSIVMHIYNLHRNPEIYSEPEKFDPDRFLPENSYNRHPYAYIPFSAGPRNCIGQKFALLEEKMILSKILYNYEITSVKKPQEITLINELILRPKDGILIKITPRH